MAEGVGTWDVQRQHYNSHVTNLSTREALQQRNEGPAQVLKHFHNHVKRQLIWRFAYKKERLLDLCCGRGGDLHKWKDTQIKYIRGLDISEREVDEARRRYTEMLDKEKRRGGLQMRCDFEAVDWLGERMYEDPEAGPASYDVVTCMFALHYFFVSENSLRTFLHNVSANLRQGGYFMGTAPSGHRVQELLGHRDELRTPMLRLAKHWRPTGSGRPPVFGAGYICDIADTVTASLEGTTDGSLEYLVDLPTLERLAAEAGLYPVCDYLDATLMNNFEQEDIDAPFKRFKPFFLFSQQLDAPPGKPEPPPPTSLEKASSLFISFVFQKTTGPDAITVPMVPECSPLPPPSAGARGLRGAPWGPQGPGPDDGNMNVAPHFHPGELGGGPGPGGPWPMGRGGMPYGSGPPMGGGGYGEGPPQFGGYGGPPGGQGVRRPREQHGGAADPNKRQRFGAPGGGAFG